MVESMVERVARAIFDDDANGYLGISVPFEGQSIGVQDRWLGLARAAIEAMREPTDAMVDTAWAEIGEHGDADVAVIYANMIDAALNEQVSG